jgi:flagellar biosynthesis/type III secretory pathway protein FliH
VDQSRLDDRSRSVPLTTGASSQQPLHPLRQESTRLQPLRFEPPRLASSNTGRITHNLADTQALEDARLAGRREAEAVMSSAIEAHRRATEQMQMAASALANALDQIEHVDLGILHDFQQQVLSLAVALAEEIVGRELRTFDDVTVASVERALSLVPDRGDVVLRVNPTDLAAVLESAVVMGHRAGDVQIVADGNVQRGGCTAVCGALQVDAQLPAVFERLREAFTS